MKAKWIAALASVLAFGLVMAPIAPAAKSPRVQNGIVHACMKTKGKKSLRGTIRIVTTVKQCKKAKGEKALTWSLLGPAAGATGETGAAGPPVHKVCGVKKARRRSLKPNCMKRSPISPKKSNC